MSIRVKVTQYESLKDMKNEGLREEAECWEAEGRKIQCGTAIMVPDDGSGPMEGFYVEGKSQGMIVWNDPDSFSTWIDADSLSDMFKRYVNNSTDGT